MSDTPNYVGVENYPRYQREHQVADFARTWRSQGISPGQAAPDFELEAATGERIRLSDFRGRPVLLHFGSMT
jgi:cytochrome oxidase Cu insertion factor (SCO1/SenC/PrrC family)